jgi:cell wall-associated NlpC family hydrolase
MGQISTVYQEDEERKMVVEEAKTWLGTPYISNGAVKGAGIDCGMLLVRVYSDIGLIPAFDPRPYPAQWALHQSAERYLAIVESYAHEIPGPPLPGDIALFKFGKCWAHGAIVTDWPQLIHANPTINSRAPCRVDDWELNSGLRKRTPRFFSIWPREPREVQS